MADEPWIPDIDTLIAELKVVREKGLGELRRLCLPELAAVAKRVSPNDPSIEDVLRDAVGQLGGKAQEAAEYDFGLVDGTALWQSTQRRGKAAEIYGISSQQFRKKPERQIIERAATLIRRAFTDTPKVANLEESVKHDGVKYTPNDNGLITI